MSVYARAQNHHVLYIRPINDLLFWDLWGSCRVYGRYTIASGDRSRRVVAAILEPHSDSHDSGGIPGPRSPLEAGDGKKQRKCRSMLKAGAAYCQTIAFVARSTSPASPTLPTSPSSPTSFPGFGPPSDPQMMSMRLMLKDVDSSDLNKEGGSGKGGVKSRGSGRPDRSAHYEIMGRKLKFLAAVDKLLGAGSSVATLHHRLCPLAGTGLSRWPCLV